MRRPHVLNVDDDDAGRFAVTHMLRDAGFEVIEAATGGEALERARENVDLVLLDVSLPDIDGLEVCRRLKADPRTSTLSVVHMSATRIADYDRVQGLEGGADGYLVEPVGRDELVATVRAHLRARAAEEKARRSEERLRVALDSARLGTWDYDIATRTLRLDARAIALLPKVKSADVSIADMLACFEPADHAPVLEALESGEALEAYLRLVPECADDETQVTANGVAWRVLRGRVFREGDNLVRFSGIIADATQRQQLFEETERRNDFERQLMGIVSHDLRNPLSAIQLTGASLEARPEPEVSKAGLRILRVSARMSRMIRELLDFTQARLGSGIPIHRQKVEVQALVTRTVEELRTGHPDRVITVRLEGPREAYLDGDRIQQVLGNLLANALSHSPERSRVMLEVRGDDQRVDFIIENENARGPISEDLMSVLFEPFTRGSREGQNDSVGLGLYIVDQIVRGHGGSIDVVSNASGTRFTVRLPI